MKNKLIIISGPTAVGKTSLSVELAKKIGGEIISADSMQVYRGMDIGTAKISKEEMQGIRHYLIDILSPLEEFNIFIFQKKAKEAINEIYERGKIPIIVGGTGFYIQSVLYDIEFLNNVDENDSLRKELEKEYDIKGADYMLERLRKLDEDSAQKIHKNNKKRLIRAIEYALLSGEKISEHNEIQSNRTSPYDFRYFVINRDREAVYDRINKRVELMFEAGLEKEFDKLLKEGCKKELTSMQGIGYKQMFAYKEGVISKDETIKLIQKDTRHFAKRQLTWFKRERDTIFIAADKLSKEELLEACLDKL